MSLIDDARKDTTPPGPKCRVCRTLDTDIGPELQEALDAEDLDSTAISRALRARGHNVSYLSVQRHRRGLCVPRR